MERGIVFTLLLAFFVGFLMPTGLFAADSAVLPAQEVSPITGGPLTTYTDVPATLQPDSSEKPEKNTAVVPVPEPTSMLLLAVCALGLFGLLSIRPRR